MPFSSNASKRFVQLNNVSTRSDGNALLFYVRTIFGYTRSHYWAHGTTQALCRTSRSYTI